MTHAERIREAERAIFAAADHWRAVRGESFATREDAAHRLDEALKERDYLRAATCPTCGGTGDGERSRYAGCPGIVTPPCPAGCDAGRRRDA